MGTDENPGALLFRCEHELILCVHAVRKHRQSWPFTVPMQRERPVAVVPAPMKNCFSLGGEDSSGLVKIHVLHDLLYPLPDLFAFLFREPGGGWQEEARGAGAWAQQGVTAPGVVSRSKTYDGSGG